MHLSAALTHLHCLVHPFLQPQWISSWHASDTSEIVLQRGSQPVLVFVHPQFAESGSSCIGVKALFQQIDWYLARLICCLSTSQVGGRFSRLLVFCVNKYFLLSLTVMTYLSLHQWKLFKSLNDFRINFPCIPSCLLAPTTK